MWSLNGIKSVYHKHSFMSIYVALGSSHNYTRSGQHDDTQLDTFLLQQPEIIEAKKGCHWIYT